MICPFDKIIENLPQKGRVLDIGSGYGIFCAESAQSRPKLRITGVELDGKKVELANKYFIFDNLVFFHGDARRIDIAEKFDVITCIDVFHHIPKKYHNELLSFIYGHLEENGILLIKDIDTRPLQKYYWNYLHDIMLSRTTDLHFRSKKDFVSCLRENGFMLLKEEDLQNLLYPHFLLICKKSGEDDR